MRIRFDIIWVGAVLLVSAVVVLTGCSTLGLSATVKSSFYEKVEGIDADGNPMTTTTDWSHKVTAPPFGKINEALVQTSYEIIDSDGGSQTISQGQSVQGMDNTGWIDAFKAGLNTVAELGNMLAPILTAPKPPKPSKPTLPEIIEEVLSNAPTP